MIFNLSKKINPIINGHHTKADWLYLISNNNIYSSVYLFFLYKSYKLRIHTIDSIKHLIYLIINNILIVLKFCKEIHD